MAEGTAQGWRDLCAAAAQEHDPENLAFACEPDP